MYRYNNTTIENPNWVKYNAIMQSYVCCSEAEAEKVLIYVENGESYYVDKTEVTHG